MAAVSPQQNQRRLHFGLGKDPKIDKGRDPLALGQDSNDRKAGGRSVARDQGARMSQQTSVPVLSPQTHAPPASGQESRCLAWTTATSPPRSLLVFCWPGICRSAFLRVTRRRCWRSLSASLFETGSGTHLLYGKWLQSAERVHQRHQCRHFDSLAGVVAVRSVQRHFHHFQVCACGSTAAISGTRRTSASRRCCFWRRRSGQPEHPVGQLSLADAGDLGAGLSHYLATPALSHHWHLRRLVCRLCIFAQLDDGKPWQSEIAPITGPMYQLFIFS